MKKNMKISLLTIIFSIIPTCNHMHGTKRKCNAHITLKSKKHGNIRVPLPFPYKKLSQEEKQNFLFLPEYCYTILEKNSDKIVIVGPLHPCKLVVIKNIKTGRTFIAHKHDGNSTADLCGIAGKNLIEPFTKEEDIFVYIFGINSKRIKEIYVQNPLPGAPAQQEKKIKDIASIIQKIFMLKKEQIKKEIFYDSDKNDIAADRHFFGQRFLAINQKLEIHSICPITGNAFNITPRKPFRKYFNEAGKRLLEIVSPIEKKYPNHGSKYESDGFLEIK